MTPQKILKSKGITADTKHHNYEYLYTKVIESMHEFAALRQTEGEAVDAKFRYDSAKAYIQDAWDGVSTQQQILENAILIASGLKTP